MTVSSVEQENYVGALTAMTLQSHSMLDSSFPWHSQWEQMQRTSRIRGWHVAWSVGQPTLPQMPVGKLIYIHTVLCPCCTNVVPKDHFAASFGSRR